jgi:hypothetical protein
MPLETVVLEGLPELRRRLDPQRWWDAIMRIAPRTLIPTAARLPALAPRGKSGKMRRGFDVRVKRISQGLIQGVEAQIGARVPYGHLVTEGHRIIARGRTRFTFSGTKRKAIPGRKVLAAERTALKLRRQGTGLGFVPGNPFVVNAVAQDRPRIVGLAEKLLQVEVTRAV